MAPAANHPSTSEASIPPTVPATVLFGDTFGAMRLRPNCEPTKKPTTSYATLQIATPRMRPTPSRDCNNSPAKPPRPPTYAKVKVVVAAPSSGRPGVTSHKNHNIAATAT